MEQKIAIYHRTPEFIYKELENLFVSVEHTKLKLQVLTHSQCGRNKVFYHDFLVKTVFVSGHTDRYWD